MGRNSHQPSMRTAERQLGALVTIPDEVVEFNIGYLPGVLGENLAEQAGGFAEIQGMGYYPALDYFRNRPDVVDPALLALTDEVAAFCIRFAEQAFRRRLVRSFAGVTVLDSRCTCYGMPRVRPHHPEALKTLAGHYAPRRLRLELRLSAVGDHAAELTPERARAVVDRALSGVFTEIELSPRESRAAAS